MNNSLKKKKNPSGSSSYAARIVGSAWISPWDSVYQLHEPAPDDLALPLEVVPFGTSYRMQLCRLCLHEKFQPGSSSARAESLYDKKKR